MVVSKSIPAVYEIFNPIGTSFVCRLGLFKGDMPDLIVPPSLPSSGAMNVSLFLTALGLTADQFLGAQWYTTALGRMPQVTVLNNPDGSVGGKININFSSVTFDLVGAATGVPTFFVAIRAGGGVASGSVPPNTYVAFSNSAYNLYDIIIGTVGDEDSDADLKVVGGNIVAGQGYRMTDLNIEY